MFSLKLFGGAIVDGPQGQVRGRLGQKRRIALLAMLAVARGRPLSRDKLLALLWPDADEERARHSLADAVYHVRKALGEEALISAGDDLLLNPKRVGSDVQAFEDALAAGDLEAAATLYTGPLLDGFHLDDAAEFERWCDRERDRLARAFAGALEQLAEAASTQGDARSAVHWWRALNAHDPYNARVVMRFMEALDQSGDRVAAIQQGRAFASLMRDDVGVDADAAVLALIEQLKAGRDPTPRAAALAPVVPTSEPTPVDSHAEPVAVGLPAVTTVQPRRVGFPALTLVAVGLLLVAMLVASLLRNNAMAAGGEHSIAVLPFADLSPGADNQYLSDGIADELISTLSEVGTLRVAPRTSSFALGKREMSVPEIARKLNVATVLEGSVLREGDRLRINVQLVDASRGFNLWSRTYDRRVRQDGAFIDDIFEVQSDIATHVVDRLDIRLRGEERRRVAAAPADNREAYTLYLKGRYFWNKRNEQDIQRALDYYQQAVDLDPGYALAWAGIADVWIFRGWYAQLAPGETFPKAKHAALRALEFDSTLAEAHASLAHIHFEYDHDWAAAEREYLRAIQLKPAYSVAHHWYGGFLSGMGRHAPARAHADTALQLDPLAPIIQTWSGLRHYFAGKYDEAVTEFRKAIELSDDFAPAHWHLSWNYSQMGRGEEAVAEARRATSIDPQNLLYVAALGQAYARAGMTREARATLTQLTELAKSRYVPAYDIALIHLGLGDRDRALQSLEQAHAERSVMIGYLRADPRVNALRDQPRFKQLLRKAALDF